jgi:ribose transport system permease protein
MGNKSDTIKSEATVLETTVKSQNPLIRTVIVSCAIIAGYIVLNFATGGRLLTTNNILSVLRGSVVTTFVVWGFCFILTMGMMDLSLGAIMVLASNVGGILAIHLKLGYVGLIFGAIAVATLLQIFNMRLMLLAKIPPWIYGLGIAMVYEAIGTFYNVSQIKAGKQAIALGDICRELGGPPWNLIVLGIGLVLAYIIFNRTSTGFALRAVGSNSIVAKMMGININSTIIRAGIVTGIFVGLAAAINESYAGRVVPQSGLNSIASIFIPLAAYLLASAFEKVYNIIIGAVISAVIITSVFNVLTLLGVPSGTWQQVVMGGGVLICGILSQRRFEGVVK